MVIGTRRRLGGAVEEDDAGGGEEAERLIDVDRCQGRTWVRRECGKSE